MHCHDCDVVFYDRESIRDHLKESHHWEQQIRIHDREVRVSTRGKGIGDMPWPEKERLYDGSNPLEDDESETSAKRQPDKQNGINKLKRNDIDEGDNKHEIG